MANTAQAMDYRDKYLYFVLDIEDIEDNSAGGYSRLKWKMWFRHYQLQTSRGVSFNIDIGGNQYSCSSGSIYQYTATPTDRIVMEGETTIWHTDAVAVSCSFSDYLNWNYNGQQRDGYASTIIYLPQLSVAPTLPNSVTASGGTNNWVDINNPVVTVNWSGATSGTYTISRYNIDATKNGWGSYAYLGGVDSSATSGSTNINLSGLGLSGGETVGLRVAMGTSDGNWWGHTYWGGSFHIYSHPTAPTTFSVPSSQEIDTPFNITWGGATSGSEGIAGYDLEIRAYNGSSWTDWVRLLTCKNQTSYSSGSPKSLKVNNVSYANNGENVKFQYRIRTSDGHYATSEWKESGQLSIKINSPSNPRRIVNIIN